MERKKKLLIALGAVTAWWLYTKRATLFSFVGDFKRLAQNDSRWGNLSLGNSNASIGVAGCLLTALTMASNAFTGKKLTPPQANEIMKAAGGFRGADTVIPTAAQALGMSAPEAARIQDDKGTPAQMAAKIDDTLKKGGLAIVHVDKGIFTGAGEHFILVHSKTSQGYAGADSATAKDTFLDPSTLTGTAMWGKVPNAYTAVGVAPIFRS